MYCAEWLERRCLARPREVGFSAPPLRSGLPMGLLLSPVQEPGAEAFIKSHLDSIGLLARPCSSFPPVPLASSPRTLLEDLPRSSFRSIARRFFGLEPQFHVVVVVHASSPVEPLTDRLTYPKMTQPKSASSQAARRISREDYFWSQAIALYPLLALI